jgi:hypothetical protein
LQDSFTFQTDCKELQEVYFSVISIHKTFEKTSTLLFTSAAQTTEYSVT